MRKCLVAVFWVCVVSLAFAGIGSAEEAQAPKAPAEQDMDYAYGIAKTVASDSVTISEYNYMTGEDEDVVYVVNPETKLENIKSLQEIAAGDDVDIGFVTKDAKKIALSIAVEKAPPEEVLSVDMNEENGENGTTEAKKDEPLVL
ncbi:MAG: hypothetical protein PHN49_12550 [Candidatus Omnitrophica bacterium]|nr:hypothetical protein [Candidatus Omnitrophota bacterium]MDD5672455.1 hypothetical protein [Candidatus Omnitrophota bacterium]